MEWKPLFFFALELLRSLLPCVRAPVSCLGRVNARVHVAAPAAAAELSQRWRSCRLTLRHNTWFQQDSLSQTHTHTERETLSERRWRCGCCPWFSSLYCTVSSSRSYKNLLQYGTDQLVFNVIKVKTCSCCVVKKYELYCRDACTLFLLSNVCIGVILILVFPLCALIFKRKKKSNSCNSDRRLVRDRVKVSERFGKSLDLVKTFFKNILIRP